MAGKRKASNQLLQRSKDLDFRCSSDNACHSVRLVKVKEVLRVVYLNFLEDCDEFYYKDQFESTEEIEELLSRFRRQAKQLQDWQYGQVTEGMVVLACHKFSTDELLFCEATVDSVSWSEHRADDHAEEQACTCKFSLKWKHGPNMGKNDTVGTENICLIQELPVVDPVLEDFIDSAQNSLEERMGNIMNQGGSSGVNPATSHGASPCPSNFREPIDVNYSDGSPHHQFDDSIGQTRDSTRTLGEEKDALKERCSRAEVEVARLKAELARAASAWEKEKAEVARLKAEHAHVASAWEKEKAEVAMLKGAASAWEKEKSELERKVKHLEEVLSEELYSQKEKERYEGLLQELKAQLNAQSQIFKAQMQVAKVEREQAILSLYEVESKLKGKRYKVGESASEWKIPEHLTLPPSDTVLSTIRNSQAFAPFRRQIEKEIREHLMKQHNTRSPTQ